MAEDKKPRAAARADSRAQRTERRAGKRQGPATPLTRERIVRTALAIVDRDGPGALSMRKLGAELDVDPMAVYHYIPNKEGLFDAIVEAVMSEIDLASEDASAPPEERIMSAATAYLKVMLAHANAMPIMLSRGPSTPAAARPVEYLIGTLRDAGLSPSEAMAGMNAIASTVRGAAGMLASEGTEPPTPEELDAFAARFPAEEFPNLTEAVLREQDTLRDFEFGVRALAKGLLLGRE